MRLPQVQINPTSRVATLLHILYLILLPLLIIGLVWADFSGAAYMVVILSKWRMLAVKPRYWLANIRANSVDIIVGFSAVVLISGTNQRVTALVWAGLYALWLTLLKPRTSSLLVGVQAFVAQGAGLIALFNNYSDRHPVFLIAASWFIGFSSARHFLTVFEDGANRTITHLWALFCAEMALVLGYWHIVYIGVLPQVSLVLMLIGYALGLGYFIYKTKSLTKSVKNQLIGFTIAVLIIIIVMSEWQAELF